MTVAAEWMMIDTLHVMIDVSIICASETQRLILLRKHGLVALRQAKARFSQLSLNRNDLRRKVRLLLCKRGEQLHIRTD